MSVPRNITGQITARGGAGAMMSNCIAGLALLVIGYPLAPESIRTTLLSWMLIVIATMRFVVGRHFQPTRSTVLARTAPSARRTT